MNLQKRLYIYITQKIQNKKGLKITMHSNLASNLRIIDLIVPFLDNNTILEAIVFTCREWVKYREVVLTRIDTEKCVVCLNIKSHLNLVHGDVFLCDDCKSEKSQFLEGAYICYDCSNQLKCPECDSNNIEFMPKATSFLNKEI